MNTKHILIFILIACFCVSEKAHAGKELSDLIAQGEAFYQKGDFEHAAQLWEKALANLKGGQNPGLYMDTLAHLVYAYKSLGFHEKALSALTEAVPVLKKSDERYRNAMFLNNLADIHLALGDLKTAVKVMEKAIAEARLSENARILAEVLNNAGNMLIADANYEEAIEAYRECLGLIDKAGAEELKATVLLNRAYSTAMLASPQPEMSEEALQHIRTLPEGYAKAENEIALAVLMIESLKNKSIADSSLSREILEVLTEAKQIGEKLNNPRILSQAYGYMGQLYEQEGRYEESLSLTRQAVFFTQQGNYPELLYLWQWQIGRLLKAKGNTEPAVQSYKKAIETLNPIRPELFRGYRSQREIFDERIRPVYIGLADLYLKQADALQIADAREEKLREARDTMEILKTLELQNFFKDECVTFTEEKKQSLDYTPPHTAVIYPISLEDRLVVLLSLPDAMIHFNMPVDFRKLKDTAKQFRRELQTRSSNRFLKNARNLYDWIIRPAEKELAARDIDTLIVAPDGALRLIPFSSLYDGQHFLIEKYAVGTVPALRLTAVGGSEPVKADILLSGLSDAVQEFSPLPGVKDELADVKQIMNARTMLFNKDFTVANLTGEFKTNPYGMLHVATHGVFGGTAKDSFLLTYDDRLDMDHLANLVEFSRFREQKITLLTLSACQTAMGNERAALGLAGVAVKAGVRSAIATLWFVDDESTSLAVKEFYRQIKTPGLSKAKALQNAQKQLIAKRRFWHPIYWAPFLLIGNWM